MAEVGLRIRVDDALRGDFVETCKLQDTTASQVLRAFMRAYVEQNAPGLKESTLFGSEEKLLTRFIQRSKD